jgi:hypothetical protein
MVKEKTGNFFKNLLHPFYKGVCKMKHLRIVTMVALLVLTLFASQVFSANFTNLDTTYVPWK